MRGLAQGGQCWIGEEGAHQPGAISGVESSGCKGEAREEGKGKDSEIHRGAP